MKSVRATKTLSYVTTSRTNTRRWVQQSGGEEDGHRRRDARSGRGENRVRSHPPNHSALPSHTPPLRPHYTAADRMHYTTQSPVWSHSPEACGVAVIRVSCPSFSSSARHSPSLPARPLSSNARGLERKLGLADRKSWIRFFSFPFCAAVAVSEGG